VDECSLWQLSAAVDGWNSVHGAEDTPAMTFDEYERLIERHADWIESNSVH